MNVLFEHVLEYINSTIEHTSGTLIANNLISPSIDFIFFVLIIVQTWH